MKANEYMKIRKLEIMKMRIRPQPVDYKHVDWLEHVRMVEASNFQIANAVEKLIEFLKRK